MNLKLQTKGPPITMGIRQKNEQKQNNTTNERNGEDTDIEETGKYEKPRQHITIPTILIMFGYHSTSVCSQC